MVELHSKMNQIVFMTAVTLASISCGQNNPSTPMFGTRKAQPTAQLNNGKKAALQGQTYKVMMVNSRRLLELLKGEGTVVAVKGRIGVSENFDREYLNGEAICGGVLLSESSQVILPRDGQQFSMVGRRTDMSTLRIQKISFKLPGNQAQLFCMKNSPLPMTLEEVQHALSNILVIQLQN